MGKCERQESMLLLQCKGSLLRGSTHLQKPKESSENQAQLAYSWLTTFQILHHLDLEIVLRFTGGAHLYNQFSNSEEESYWPFLRLPFIGLVVGKSPETCLCKALSIVGELEERVVSKVEIPPIYFHGCSFLWKERGRFLNQFLERRWKYYCTVGVHASEPFKKGFLSFSRGCTAVWGPYRSPSVTALTGLWAY